MKEINIRLTNPISYLQNIDISRMVFKISMLLFVSLGFSSFSQAQDFTFNPTAISATAVENETDLINVLIRNNSAGSLVISGFTITGTDADQFSFNQGNISIPWTMNSFDEIDVVVVFQPTSVGVKTATLSMTSDSPDSPHTIALYGVSNSATPAPLLSLSIANYFNIGTVNVGEPQSKTVTISNLGTANLSISSLDVTNTGATQFELLTSLTFPLDIAAGNSTDIDINFIATAPASVALQGGLLTIVSNDPASPLEYVLRLTETAPDPAAIVDLGFGNVPIASDSTLTFTVTNTQDFNEDGDWIITGLSFASNPDLFSTATVFPIRVAPGASDQIAVTLSPDVFEYISEVITVEGNVTTTLNATGRGAVKSLSIPTSIAYGDVRRDVEYGQEVSRIAIRTTGGQRVNITGISFSGANAASFESFVSLPYAIENSLDWPVSFFTKISGLGAKTATMTITSDAINSPHTVSLTANAVYPPILSTSTDRIKFFDFNRLTTKDTTITITNLGNETLVINNIYINPLAEEYRSQFSFNNLPAMPIRLELGETTSVGVRFAPTGYSGIYADLNIVSNNEDVNSSLTKVALHAEIVYPSSIIADEYDLSLDTLRFGDVSTNGFSIDSVLVSNQGTGELLITNIVFSGGSQADYSIPNAAYPMIVAAGGALKIPVRFEPYTTTQRSATLTMESNNFGSLTTGVTGRGIAPLISFPNSNFVGAAKVNGTTQIKRIITNFGNVPALVSSFDLSGADATLFDVSSVDLPVNIAAGDSIEISISMSPIAEGAFTADLEIVSDAVNGPIISTLTGSGYLSPTFFTETDTVVVSGVAVPTVSIIKIGIENKGTLDLELTSAFLEVGSNGAFSAGANAFGLPLTIAPGAVDSVEVRFAPLRGGLHEAVLSITTNDDEASAIVPNKNGRIYLSAVAEGPIPLFSVSELVFDSTAVGGGERTLLIEATNIGTGNLRFDFFKPDPTADFNIFYKGYEPPPFDASDAAFTILEVPAGETQKINVVFSPQQLGSVNSFVLLVMRDGANIRFSEMIDVSGIGKEPSTVVIGDLTFVANDFETTGTIKKLMGSVRVGNLKLGEEVTFDLANDTMIGLGDVYMDEVPANGALTGGLVKIRTGGFGYFVDGVNKTLSTNPAQTEGLNFFEIIGLTLETSDIQITDDGVLLGGGLKLPEIVFGPDAGFTLDNILISQSNGIDIQGQFALAPLSVFDAFSLDEVVIEFDSFKDCFSGTGGISVDAGLELSITAGVVFKNGGLDSVALEIETLPGIPLGTTGFALAGGNGAIGGIQIPPLSLALGVDIVPVPPGANKVVRFDNVGFAYTFGRSFTAEGKLIIFDLEMAAAIVEGSNTGVTAEAYFSLLEIFKGQAGISVHVINDVLKVSGNANLQYTIPKMQSDVPDFIRGAVNEFLPITLAEVSTSFSSTRITAAVVVPPIPARISATIKMIEGKAEVVFGIEFTLLNDESSARGARMNVKELPYSMTYEYNHELARRHHLEGRSIVINSGIDRGGRAIAVADDTAFPFSISESHESIIIRVEGVDEAPVFSLVLPTGQEVNAENALSMGYAYTVYEEGKQSHIFLSNTLAGDYIIKIAGSGEYQIDIAGAAFGPKIQLKDATFNESTDEVEINWEDEDLDSDAEISLYFDTDQEGADGEIIAAGISENDATDQFVWDASDVPNGTYYVYAVMDDSINAPSISYAAEPVVIGRTSAIAVPVLDDPVLDGSEVNLTWSASDQGETYFVYYAEDEPVTIRSSSYAAGKKLTFTFPELITGRDYQFAVVAVDANKMQSNLSNVVTLSFVSDTENNVPNISEEGILKRVKIGETYQTTIMATDGDVDDVLTYTLTTFPEGMTISNNVITWTPTATQVGNSQVTVQVEDLSKAIDSIQYYVTAVNENSSRASLSFNNGRFNGLDQVVQVTLTDAGLNVQSDQIDNQEVKVYSQTDASGIMITLTETSTNSGQFVGSFGFNEAESLSGLIAVSVADSVFVSYQDAFPEEEVLRYLLFEKAATPNQFPTSISINNTVLDHQTKQGDVVGLLMTEDVDDTEFTYELVTGVGAAHNSLFEIDGQALVTKVSFDELEVDTLNVRIRTLDTKNGFYEQIIILTKGMPLNINEAMVLNQVVLYPNPTTKKVFLNIDSQKGAIRLTIISADGRRLQSKVYDKRWNDTKVSMNVADLIPGTYYIQIEQNGRVVNKRLVKE